MPGPQDWFQTQTRPAPGRHAREASLRLFRTYLIDEHVSSKNPGKPAQVMSRGGLHPRPVVGFYPRQSLGGTLQRGQTNKDFSAVMRMMGARSEEHTSELQSLMRISYAVFCLKNKKRRRSKKSYC